MSITYVKFVLFIILIFFIIECITNIEVVHAFGVDWHMIKEKVNKCSACSYIRTPANIALENHIYNTTSGNFLTTFLQERLLFFYEYCLAYDEYYSYVQQQVYVQSGTPFDKTKLINQLMMDFYKEWELKYYNFLVSILDKKG